MGLAATAYANPGLDALRSRGAQHLEPPPTSQKRRSMKTTLSRPRRARRGADRHLDHHDPDAGGAHPPAGGRARLRPRGHGALAVLDGDRGRHGHAGARPGLPVGGPSARRQPRVDHPAPGRGRVEPAHPPGGHPGAGGGGGGVRPLRAAGRARHVRLRAPHHVPDPGAGRAHGRRQRARARHRHAGDEARLRPAGRDRGGARHRRAHHRPHRSRPGPGRARHPRAAARPSPSIASGWPRPRASTARRSPC